jgi:flagellin
MSLAQIATNVNALRALDALNKVNSNLSMHQLRLATGQKVNSAGDNPAAWQIGKTLEATSAGLSQALSNVGDAQSMLGIAQGGQQEILSILQTMQTEVTQAANDTLGASQRTAISNALTDQAAEITAIVGQTTYNGMSLLDGTFSGKSLQVGSATTDTLSIGIAQNHSAASLGVSSLTVSSAAQASIAPAAVQAAIVSVNSSMGSVGSVATRLQFKSDLLSSMITNTDAAKSAIMNADVAQEQVQVAQDQILQQTATAALTQANNAPQSLLALFR